MARPQEEDPAPPGGADRDRELLEGCLEALQRVAPVEDWKWTWAVRADAALELGIDGRRFQFAVVVKRGLRDANVGPVVHTARQLERADRPLVVCADRIPDTLGETLRTNGVGYLDRGGNAFLRAPGLCLLVAGRRPAATRVRRTLTGTVARLLGVFLRDTDAGDLVQKELATRAGIALGAVGRARQQLEEEHVLARTGKRGWRVVDREGGLQRFADGWATVIRPKLHPTRYRLLKRGKRGAQLEGVLKKRHRELRCLLGGEQAAALLTKGLRTEYATLHVPAHQQRVVARALDLVPDQPGPITLLDRYGTGDEYGDRHTAPLAHPLLVWAECLTVPDERVVGIAAELRNRLLEAAP